MKGLNPDLVVNFGAPVSELYQMKADLTAQLHVMEVAGNTEMCKVVENSLSKLNEIINTHERKKLEEGV